jgi:hypothetical protein
VSNPMNSATNNRRNVAVDGGQDYVWPAPYDRALSARRVDDRRILCGTEPAVPSRLVARLLCRPSHRAAVCASDARGEKKHSEFAVAGNDPRVSSSNSLSP